MTFKFRSKLWLYDGYAAWHFISLPKKMSYELKNEFGDVAAGWGSLPVIAKIGSTKWKTSIFPDRKTNTYLLPVKKAVRQKEQIEAEDFVEATISINI